MPRSLCVKDPAAFIADIGTGYLEFLFVPYFHVCAAGDVLSRFLRCGKLYVALFRPLKNLPCCMYCPVFLNTRIPAFCISLPPFMGEGEV